MAGVFARKSKTERENDRLKKRRKCTPRFVSLREKGVASFVYII